MTAVGIVGMRMPMLTTMTCENDEAGHAPVPQDLAPGHQPPSLERLHELAELKNFPICCHKHRTKWLVT